MRTNDIAARIEAFNDANGGGGGLCEHEGACHLYLLETEAPVARLRPTGKRDDVRLACWSHRGAWEDVDDFGGCVMPPGDALEFIADEGIFWIWA